MIKRIPMYTALCDNCGADLLESDEFSCWGDPSLLVDEADNHDWHITSDEKYYCTQCHTFDDDDNLVIDLTRKKHVPDPDSEEEIEALHDRFFPYGKTAGEGSSDRFMYESRKESFIWGFRAAQGGPVGLSLHAWAWWCSLSDWQRQLSRDVDLGGASETPAYIEERHRVVKEAEAAAEEFDW